MNNESENKTIDKEAAASNTSSIIMPGIPNELTPKMKEEKSDETQIVKKKKIPKQFIIIFGVLGLVIIASIVFMIFSNTPVINPNNKQNTITGVDGVKEKALNDMKEKTAQVKLTIKEVGSYLDTINPMDYSIIEIDTKVIRNYDISLTSNDSLEFYYLRYYNMDYNYAEFSTLNKYDKIYVVVINKSSVNNYSYQFNYNTKKTYSAENYNNYGIKISYTASEGDVSKLTEVNAIYDEIHQNKYIRIPVVIANVGNSAKVIYEDLTFGLSYSKLPTSTIWTKSQCKKLTLNLKSLEEYLVNEKDGVKKLTQTVYKLNITKDQIEPLLYGIEPLDSAPATITFKNGKISTIVYDFKNKYEGYKKLVMTIEISNINTSGDISIPNEATK